MICRYCDEPILPTDEIEFPSSLAEPHNRIAHIECAARKVIGSVGHLLGKCYCYGGTEEDPPGMTYRQAAKVALDLFRRQQEGLD